MTLIEAIKENFSFLFIDQLFELTDLTAAYNQLTEHFSSLFANLEAWNFS